MPNHWLSNQQLKKGKQVWGKARNMFNTDMNNLFLNNNMVIV